MVGQAGLHQQAPAAGPATDQAGGARQEGEGLLTGPVARGEQLGVDVEEGHDVGRADLVEGGLGADVHLGVGQRRAARRGGHLHDRRSRRRRERRRQLVAQAGHAGPQRLEPTGPAGQAHHRPLGPAPAAHEALLGRLVQRPPRTPRSGPTSSTPRRPAASPAPWC